MYLNNITYYSVKAQLKTFDVAMLGVSMVIGVGIFRTPAMVASKAGSVELFLTAWVVGALISYCGALTFAEIGSRYPVVGAFYKIFSYCYHPSAAFSLNWSLIIMNASSSATVALIGAEYLASVLDPTGVQKELIQIIVVSTLTILYTANVIGIRAGATLQNVLSVVKIVLVLFFCAGIFLSAPESSGNVAVPQPMGSNTVALFFAAMVPIFFSYGGYQNAINFGRDTHNAVKTMPRAILISMVIVMVLYVTLNVSYVHALGFENCVNSLLIASALGERLLGSIGRNFTAVVIFLSVAGFLNSTFMFNPRLMYAMAEEGMLPSMFMRTNSKIQVQTFSLTVFFALVLIAFYSLGSFDQLLRYVMFNDTLILALAASCIFILRKRGVGEGAVYSVPSLVIPIIFICTLLGMTMSVVSEDPIRSLAAIGVFAVGFVLWWVRTTLVKNT